jgi:S1-C subfamily serine protease
VIAAAASGGTITVTFADGRVGPATVVGRDPQTDVAVLLAAEIAGNAATSAEQLLTATLQNRPGDAIRLTYVRAGATHEAEVTLGAR